MNYYPGIQYFTLLKPMPGADIGSTVTIISADGRECLIIHGSPEVAGECMVRNVSIEMHIDMAKDYPDWFKPVTEEEHKEICEESLISYFMAKKNCNRQEAIDTIAKIDKFESFSE